MKDITRQSRMRRFNAPTVLSASRSKDVRVTYGRFKKANDNKRWGREMTISLGNASISLNGRGINAILTALKQAGEIV